MQEERKTDSEFHNIKNISILVVEDNKTNQLVMDGMLEDYDIAVAFANNGQEAVEMVENNTYDLILMDLQMPIMGGIEATRLIKQKHPEIPIIALSADVLPEDNEKSKAFGMIAYMAKPIDSYKLLSYIDALFLKN